MVEVDDRGWAPIHHAASRNYAASVERFIETSGAEQLELKTQDGVGNTPLLLAVMSAAQQTVELLVLLGADTAAVNSQRLGVTELCAMHGHMHLLDYFISLRRSQLNIFKNLIIFLDSNSAKEALCAGSIIATATVKTPGTSNSWSPSLIKEGLVPVLLQVLAKDLGDVKQYALNILHNILKYENVKEQILQCNGFQVLIPLIQEEQRKMLSSVINIIDELVSEKNCVEAMCTANAIPALVNIIAHVNNVNISEKESRESILIPAVHILGVMAEQNADCKDTIGKQEYLSVLVSLFKESESRKLLIVLSKAVANILSKHPKNQDAFIKENGVFPLIQMEKSKHKVMQICAINLLNRLVEGNPNAQKNILESNGIAPLVPMLKQSRTQHMQEAVAEALWAVAGTDVGAQREVAARIGVNLLVEFLGCQSHKLHLIGIMGLSLLVQSPYDIRDTVASTNSMQYLTRLLQSHSENVVLSTIRAIRHMCLGVGYIPHRKNQAAIANSKGLNFLIALMVKSHLEMIQVEAAHTLAAVVLGNTANMELLYNSAGFSHMHLLRLLYSTNEEVRLLAGAALATFAFNSFCQQRRIVGAGGVQWHNFKTFLQSEQEIHRVHAAFQATVLARIIPDNESANTSALGVKILVDTLQHSTSDITLALAADCVARLAHTQSGVPDALVAIDMVPVLCQLLSSTSEEVQGCAAIALRYLSFNPQGERQLLKRRSEYQGANGYALLGVKDFIGANLSQAFSIHLVYNSSALSTFAENLGTFDVKNFPISSPFIFFQTLTAIFSLGITAAGFPDPRRREKRMAA
ncbi:uncharacterized protein LOC144799873 isoform X2 [Lissotriton helveticus]